MNRPFYSARERPKSKKCFFQSHFLQITSFFNLNADKFSFYSTRFSIEPYVVYNPPITKRKTDFCRLNWWVLKCHYLFKICKDKHDFNRLTAYHTVLSRLVSYTCLNRKFHNFHTNGPWVMNHDWWFSNSLAPNPNFRPLTDAI